MIPSLGDGESTIEGIEALAFDSSGTLWAALSARGASGDPGDRRTDCRADGPIVVKKQHPAMRFPTMSGTATDAELDALEDAVKLAQLASVPNPLDVVIPFRAPPVGGTEEEIGPEPAAPSGPVRDWAEAFRNYEENLDLDWEEKVLKSRRVRRPGPDWKEDDDSQEEAG
ncbi:MAG: hypothetical protein IIA41_12265 [SAR324 cluster bacterium]|nr:hypothetical protein [SAR324 cluster bacterium]